MKKLLSTMLVIVMLFTMCSVFSAQTPAEISIAPVSGRIGDTVSVIVSISPGTNLGNMRLNFAYDKQKLQYVDNSPVGVGQNGITAEGINDNGISIGYITSTGIKDGGEIMSVRFKILSETVPDKIDLTLDVSEFVDADTDLEIPNTVESSYISVVEKIKGDINADGKVELADAMSGFLWLAGKASLDAEAVKIADMDDNGKTGLTDIMKIFMIVAGR